MAGLVSHLKREICIIIASNPLLDGESGTSDANLQWMVGGVSQWKVNWDPNVWHNIAYEIVRQLPLEIHNIF